MEALSQEAIGKKVIFAILSVPIFLADSEVHGFVQVLNDRVSFLCFSNMHV